MTLPLFCWPSLLALVHHCWTHVSPLLCLLHTLSGHQSPSAEPPGKSRNTGVGNLSLFRQIFLTQESNQGLLHCRQILYQLRCQGSPTHNLSFPCGSAGKESAFIAGDLGLIPGLGRSPGERKGYPLLYSGLENSMDCMVHGITKSWTRLISFHFSVSIIFLADTCY